MNMIMGLILAAAAIVPVQEQSARVDMDHPAFWTGAGGWRVFAYPEEQMCDLGMATPDDEYLTIGFRPREPGVNLLVTNKHATSLRVGEIRRLSVSFASVADDEPHGVHAMSFEVVDADGRKLLSAANTYPTFLDDMAKAAEMTVSTPQQGVVAKIPLWGTMEAVRQLRLCAIKAAGMDPEDPFLKN